MKKLLLILMFIVGSLGLHAQKIADLPTATSTTSTDLLIIDKTAATSGITIGNFFNTVLFGDGTVSLPSISLLTDPNTGLYTTGADAISISAGGVEAARFVEATTTQLLVGDGTALLPSLSFISSPSYGLYISGTTLNFSANGAAAVQLTSTGAYRGAAVGSWALLNVDATATVPVITIQGDGNTGAGSAGADLLSLIAGGKEGIRIDGALGGIEVIIKDSLIIEDFATPMTTVLSPTSTGFIDTLETAVIGDIEITHSGGMCYVSTPGTQTIGTGGTFERLNEGAIAYTAAHLQDFTHSDGRLTYTGTATKHFHVIVYVNIESDETAALVQIRLAKDGTTIAATEMQHDYTAVDTDAVLSFGWLMELATNEYLEVFGTSDTNADTFEVHNLQMIISQH